jgi:hypothetical protein
LDVVKRKAVEYVKTLPGEQFIQDLSDGLNSSSNETLDMLHCLGYTLLLTYIKELEHDQQAASEDSL